MNIDKLRFYGVTGDRVVGPFGTYQDAKSAIGVPNGVRYDDSRDSVYRYGTKFVGSGESLQAAGILPKPVHNRKVVNITTTTTLIFDDGTKRDLPTLQHYLNENLVLV